MKGAKLTVTKTSSSATAMTTSSEQLLTEIVLWRKIALKKVIATGWADVVIADNVVFTKKKDDYAFQNRRALLAEAATTKSFTLQEMPRQAASSSVSSNTRSSQVSSNWTILWPTGDSRDKVSIDAQVTGPDTASFTRVDSDLLPERSIGKVVAMGGEIDVAGTLSDTAERELLVIRPKANATSTTNATNTTTFVNLAPTVSLTTITSVASSDGKVVVVVDNTNTTIADYAITLFLNGAGNLFVLMNASFVYVDDAHFRVAGFGFLQVEIGEIRAAAGISAARDFAAI